MAFNMSTEELFRSAATRMKAEDLVSHVIVEKNPERSPHLLTPINVRKRSASRMEVAEGQPAEEHAMSKLIAFALAAIVSLSGATVGFAKSKHHHHRAGMISSDVNNTSVKSVNNPTPTRNDPPGTRTNCRGGCQ